MTPRGLDVGTDEGIVNAIGVYSLFVLALGAWVGYTIGRKRTR